jgi:Uma2 family endonuclease
MAESGVFGPDERLELIDGEVFRMTPQGSRHATAIGLAAKALESAFGPNHHVRVQLPLALGPSSEPEPDLAVVKGGIRDYCDAHPSFAILVLEVSDETIAFDRNRKGAVYARSGIPEFWISNLAHRKLEVYRDAAPSGPGWEYKSVQHYSAGQSVAPLHATRAEIAVADLLP